MWDFNVLMEWNNVCIVYVLAFPTDFCIFYVSLILGYAYDFII